jgi:hypothetical protein
MQELPWSERVNMLSINPDAATRDDVARMAAELSEAKFISINIARDEICADIIDSDDLCDYCKLQSSCSDEMRSLRTCSYFSGRKLRPC